MAKVFVVPDVHLKDWMFDEARKLLGSANYDKVVLLGDLVDDWEQGSNLKLYEKTLEKAYSFMADFDAILCYGNHDVSYKWERLETGYSGQARETVLDGLGKLEAGMKEENLGFIHRIDYTLFSHAGLTKEFVDTYLSAPDLDIDEAIWEINHMDPVELWTDTSPLWARPQDGYFQVELYPNDMFQVVGHTPVVKPMKQDYLLTLDTFSTTWDGRAIGDERFVIVDSVTGAWEYAE